MQRKTFQNRADGVHTQRARGPWVCVVSEVLPASLLTCRAYVATESTEMHLLALLVSNEGENKDYNLNESSGFC